MQKPKKVPDLSIDDYLKFEQSSATKHEYVRGQIFALSGADEAHNLICINMAAALHNFLQGTGCRVYHADMKVRVEAADSFYYPDLMVTCEAYDAKSVFKTAPTLIVEVLSASTKHIDRREKLVAYRQLSSLRHYVMVSQNKSVVELYRKSSDGQWDLAVLGMSDDLVLEDLAGKRFALPVADIYNGLDLPSTVEESEEEYELSF